jgi:membrane protein implicated in regulation of membrane protease activity
MGEVAKVRFPLLTAFPMPVTPILWLALAAMLLALVLVGADSDGLLLIAGLAGLLLGLFATVLPVVPAAAQLVLFAALVGGGYVWLRRWSAHRQARTIPPSARAELAEVISPFDASGEGRVRWQGQSWAAVTLAPSEGLIPGTQVTVMGREGTRLQVLPRQKA